MADEAGEQDVWAAIAKIRIAMLTIEEEGQLHSRPMASLVRPEEGKIYFVTRLDAKVGEIGGSAPVNLAYSDPHENSYVSVSGTARTSQDREKLRELWSMFTEAWLPEGPDGEDVALVTVEPGDAKLWDSTSSTLVYAAKVLKAVATQTPPDGGTVAEVSLGDGGRREGREPQAAPNAKAFRAYQDALDQDGEGLAASSAGGPSI
jgi:general stress protein 26